MILLGYIAAMLIGVSLGLIGAGGSILAVPVLVFMFGVPPVLATSYSLFVVGISTLFGSISYMKSKCVNYRNVIVFGIPSLIGVYCTRKLLLPQIPDTLCRIDNMVITKDIGMMILFSILMIAASFSMIKKSKMDANDDREPPSKNYRYGLIIIEGLIVGGVTGLVGAGGGFLIIPALVILAGEPMKKAVGTSLLIIAAKSLIGFSGDVSNHMNINWDFLFLFSSFAIAGILVGAYLSKFISGEKLRPAFGWFVLIMGLCIITQQLLGIKF